MPLAERNGKGGTLNQNKRNKELRTHTRIDFLMDEVKEKRNHVRLRDNMKVSLRQSTTFFLFTFYEVSV